MGALCLTSSEAQNFIYFPVMSSLIPHGASAAVLKQSEPVPDEAIAVQGPNFDERLTLETLLDSYERIGFQANSLGKAINIVNKMVSAPLSLSVCHLPTPNIHSTLPSVVGAFLMNQSLRMNRRNVPTPTSAPERAATSFSDTPRISYPLAFAKSFCTS